IDRSEREVSGIMLEVATALGRPLRDRTLRHRTLRHRPLQDITAPEPADEGDVPTAARLRAAYLDPGREARRQAAGAAPLSPRTQLARAPQRTPGRIAVPAEWMRCPARGLDRVSALTLARRAVALTGIDGVVSD